MPGSVLMGVSSVNRTVSGRVAVNKAGGIVAGVVTEMGLSGSQPQ